MNLRFSLFVFMVSIYGFCPDASFADDNRVLLAPVVNYSFCTPYYGIAGHSLGIVGTDWALTFEVPEESFSGNVYIKKAYLYRGQDMHRYIRKPAGPRQPPLPKTEAYTKVVLAGINVEIQRIKIYDKTMGPIEVVVDDFTVNDQQYHIPGRVKILCMGPLP